MTENNNYYNKYGDQLKELIDSLNIYMNKEFDQSCSLNDIDENGMMGIAFTNDEDDNELQVNLDFNAMAFTYEINGILWCKEKYSISDMIHIFKVVNFDEIIVPEISYRSSNVNESGKIAIQLGDHFTLIDVSELNGIELSSYQDIKVLFNNVAYQTYIPCESNDVLFIHNILEEKGKYKIQDYNLATEVSTDEMNQMIEQIKTNFDIDKDGIILYKHHEINLKEILENIIQSEIYERKNNLDISI